MALNSYASIKKILFNAVVMTSDFKIYKAGGTRIALSDLICAQQPILNLPHFVDFLTNQSVNLPKQQQQQQDFVKFQTKRCAKRLFGGSKFIFEHAGLAMPIANKVASFLVQCQQIRGLNLINLAIKMAMMQQLKLINGVLIQLEKHK